MATSSGDLAIIISTIILASAYALVIIYSLSQVLASFLDRAIRDRHYRKFKESVISYFKKFGPMSLDNLDDILSGIQVPTGLNLLHNTLCLKLLSRLGNELLIESLDYDLGDAEIKGLYKNIQELRERLGELSPFDDLREKSKQVISSIVKEHGISVRKNQNAKELIELVKDYETDVELMKKRNKWSMPLAILGFIATVVFGLMQILAS